MKMTRMERFLRLHFTFYNNFEIYVTLLIPFTPRADKTVFVGSYRILFWTQNNLIYDYVSYIYNNNIVLCRYLSILTYYVDVVSRLYFY